MRPLVKKAKRLKKRMSMLRVVSTGTKRKRKHPRKLQLRKKKTKILRISLLPKRSRRMKRKRKLVLLNLVNALVTKSTAPLLRLESMSSL